MFSSVTLTTARDVMLSSSAPLGLTHTAAVGLLIDFSMLGQYLG